MLSRRRRTADTNVVTDESEAEAEAGTRTETAPSVSWAAASPPAGVDLSVGAVLGIAVAMYALGEVVSWRVAGPSSTYVGWIYDPSIDAVTRQMLVPSLFEAAMWLAVVTALGWRRAVGFGGGVMSVWGIVPVVTFCPMLFVGVADPSIAERGLPLLGVALVALLVAAFVEELAYRGFLQHGLSRRLGGASAVGLASLLFALAHLPSMLGTDQRLLPMLAIHFGSAVLFSRIRLATDSIWYPAAVHAFLNMLTLLYANWGPETGPGFAVFMAIKFGAVLIGLASWVMLVANSRRLATEPTARRPLAAQDHAWSEAQSGADHSEK